MGVPNPSSQAASRRESMELGRKNRAFLAVKHELAEREKNKKKRLKAAKKGKLKENPMDEVGIMFSVRHEGYCSVVMAGLWSCICVMSSCLRSSCLCPSLHVPAGGLC